MEADKPAMSTQRHPMEGKRDIPIMVVFVCMGLVTLTQLYSVIPMFNDFVHDMHIGESLALWTQTGYGIAYALALLAWGTLADKVGPTKVVVTSAVLSTLAAGLVAAAPTGGALIGFRVVQGVVAASFSPAAFAIIPVVVAPERRNLTITLLTSSFLAAASLGPVFAGSVKLLIGWRGVYVVSAVLFLALGVVLYFIIPPVRGSAVGETNILVPFRTVLSKVPAVLLLLATVTMLSTFVGLLTTFLQYTPMSGAGKQWVSLIGLPAVILVLLANSWIHRVSVTTRLTACGVVSALANLGILATDSSVAWVVLMFVIVFTVGIIGPSLIEGIMPFAVPYVGVGTALFTFFLFIGASIGPQLAGVAQGLPGMVAIDVGLQIVLIVLSLITSRFKAGDPVILRVGGDQ
ncbi:MFS transporter [Cutibacterium sp. WCA-380-WT-3A]|uniref:MFS transporter n=1 Tax=Cutibacterium porci TaxID=2605781 RepID=A0A7K0J9G4_9ACTN|nr:MFS transporter [Cutibacterium porci]MSS46609.1 MFS transporter [Cutibacterium porci]